MPDTLRFIGLIFSAIILPLCLIGFIYFVLRHLNRSLKPLERSSMTDIQNVLSQTELRYIEQREFQQELLAEMWRHNTALEHQSEILSQLLQQLGKT